MFHRVVWLVNWPAFQRNLIPPSSGRRPSYQTTRCSIPEDSRLHFGSCWSAKLAALPLAVLDSDPAACIASSNSVLGNAAAATIRNATRAPTAALLTMTAAQCRRVLCRGLKLKQSKIILNWHRNVSFRTQFSFLPQICSLSFIISFCVFDVLHIEILVPNTKCRKIT